MSRQLGVHEIISLLKRNPRLRTIVETHRAARERYGWNEQATGRLVVEGLIPRWGMSWQDDYWGTVVIDPDVEGYLRYTVGAGAPGDIDKPAYVADPGSILDDLFDTAGRIADVGDRSLTALEWLPVVAVVAVGVGIVAAFK